MGLQEDRPVSRWQKMVFLGSPKRSVRPVWLIRAKKSALSEPHVCANTCRHLLLDPVLSRHPPCSLVQVMLTLEDRDVKWFTWAVVLTSLGYLLLLLVSIFPFWVRLVKDESQEVFFSGLFENCFQIKCWKPRPLSSTEGWGQGMGQRGGCWATEAWRGPVGQNLTRLQGPFLWVCPLLGLEGSGQLGSALSGEVDHGRQEQMPRQ